MRDARQAAAGQISPLLADRENFERQALCLPFCRLRIIPLSVDSGNTGCFAGPA
jgi:hypothetical protein